MRAHVVEFGTLPRTWPGLTLRKKRVRLVEEQLGALAVEARLLGRPPATAKSTER